MNQEAAFGGIDWATDDHAVCIVDALGHVLEETVVAHTAAGLVQLCATLRHHRVTRVAIERPDGPVVDALMTAGFDVVVLPSRSVKAFRERYALSGSKSDRRDAFVLADCLRSDGHRWRNLQPDTPATVTLRAHVRARRDLVETRVAVANQLRAHLLINMPSASACSPTSTARPHDDSSADSRRSTAPPGSARLAWRTGSARPATTPGAAQRTSTHT